MQSGLIFARDKSFSDDPFCIMSYSRESRANARILYLLSREINEARLRGSRGYIICIDYRLVSSERICDHSHLVWLRIIVTLYTSISADPFHFIRRSTYLTCIFANIKFSYITLPIV